MNEQQLENLTPEQIEKLPLQLRIRLGYLRLEKERKEKEQQEEQQEQIELKDGDKVKNTPQELIKQAYDKMLKQEEKDGLSD